MCPICWTVVIFQEGGHVSQGEGLHLSQAARVGFVLDRVPGTGDGFARITWEVPCPSSFRL
jgi:hypothetical protein